MVYFSFNDFVDCEQSGEIYKVRKLGENVVKYEQISKTGKNENSIIEIIKNKNELKKFLKDFFEIDEAIGLNDIVYCNKIKSKIDRINENIVICKIKNKEIFIIIKEISEIDTNITYKMFEHSTNIISRWNKEKENQNTRNPIVIPIVIYTGEKIWKNSNSQVRGKIKYVKFKNNRINFSYNVLNINEMSENDLKYMESEVARKIKELKNKYLQIN